MPEKVRSRQFVPNWVSEDGPASNTVLSTRVRLARNIVGSPFPARAGEADLRRTADLVLDAVYGSDGKFGRLRVVRPEHLPESERLALVDARVVSRQHIDGGKSRLLVLNETGTLSLMVNEEDHLRIQSILPGLQPMSALQMAQQLDKYIGAKVEYAHADNYGYLTSSVANVGTGLRVSVMLHLVGLSFLGEAVPALTAAAKLKISVRGLFGEGTQAYGDIFQISNETTLGFTEKEITSRIRAAAEHLVSREREAKRKLATEKKGDIMDTVEMVKARLIDAHSLDDSEAMKYLSILRLGAELGAGSQLSTTAFKELLVSMRLGISASGGRTPTISINNDKKRAKLLRERVINEWMT
jgi:protein arginine kinase